MSLSVLESVFTAGRPRTVHIELATCTVLEEGTRDSATWQWNPNMTPSLGSFLARLESGLLPQSHDQGLALIAQDPTQPAHLQSRGLGLPDG